MSLGSHARTAAAFDRIASRARTRISFSDGERRLDTILWPGDFESAHAEVMRRNADPSTSEVFGAGYWYVDDLDHGGQR